MRWLPLVVLMVAACSKDDVERKAEAEPDDCAVGGETELALISKLTFAREADGVSLGFDLDGEASTNGGMTGCGVGDQVSPDGVEGIDNSFAKLLPALEQTEAAALEDIIVESIRSGGLILLAQLDDVEDPYDDGCVDLSLVPGMGLPMVGADGEILPYQTFHRDPDGTPSELPGLSISDGRMEGGPTRVDLPFSFLDADLVFHVEGAQLRVERTDDGRIRGLVAGGIAIQDLKDLAHNTGIGAEVEDLLDSVLDFSADLVPDETGQCTQISAVIEYEAIPAFFYDE